MKIYAITPVEKPVSKLAKIAKKGVAVAAGVAIGLAAGAIHNTRTNPNKQNDMYNTGNYGKVFVIIQNSDSEKANKIDYTQNGKFTFKEDVKPEKEYEKVEPEVLPAIEDDKSEQVVLPEIKEEKTEPKYEKVEPETLPAIDDVKVEPEIAEPEVQPEKTVYHGKGSLYLIARDAKLKHDIKQWKDLQHAYLRYGDFDKIDELQYQIDAAEAERVELQIQIKENAKSREEAAALNKQ